MQQEIVEKLREILVKDLFVDIPTDMIGETDGLQTVVGLDSVGFIELRAAAEQHFGIEISDDDFGPENFRSIGDLAHLVMRLKGSI